MPGLSLAKTGEKKMFTEVTEEQRNLMYALVDLVEGTGIWQAAVTRIKQEGIEDPDQAIIDFRTFIEEID